MIIDISTDGVPYIAYTSYTAARNAALDAAETAFLADVTTNIIGVGNMDQTFIADLADAGGGFYTTADDFASFQSALSRKLYRELQGGDPVPEPSTFLLLGGGLIGLALYGRKRKQS